ncbi:MAG: hypothetical protein EOO16_17200 [Chitinophagaceae bacterium]|nr:MAG: hypothetical protein EOO16_17200 [Chitinophagaceae bacterium]
MDEDDYPKGMEYETRRYLKKVLNTLFVGLFWLIAQFVFGIFFAGAFPIGGRVDAVNIIYYCFFALSLAGLIWYFYRTWRK